jgi:hypothetical protein
VRDERGSVGRGERDGLGKKEIVRLL